MKLIKTIGAIFAIGLLTTTAVTARAGSTGGEPEKTTGPNRTGLQAPTKPEHEPEFLFYVLRICHPELNKCVEHHRWPPRDIMVMDDLKACEKYANEIAYGLNTDSKLKGKVKGSYCERGRARPAYDVETDMKPH